MIESRGTVTETGLQGTCEEERSAAPTVGRPAAKKGRVVIETRGHGQLSRCIIFQVRKGLVSILDWLILWEIRVYSIRTFPNTDHEPAERKSAEQSSTKSRATVEQHFQLTW